MYELYVKLKIAAGLQVVADGRTMPHEDIKRRLMDKKRAARKSAGPIPSGENVP
jgi:predicted transcriptional regulator